MDPSTMPLRLEDLAPVREFLDTDPVSHAVVIQRALRSPDPHDVFVDGIPPKAVLACTRPSWAHGATGLALHAVDPEAEQAVLDALPSGEVFFHLTEEWQLPPLEARAQAIEARSAWLFALDPQDFVDQQRHEVRPLTPEWASLVAKAWEPEWPAEPYVRARIEEGPSVAIYEDGRPVAWAMTHFETDRVSMMGFLHVLEPYRRKGYARSVGSALVKDILRRGKIPVLHVYADNVPSLELTPTLGFHKVKRQVWGDAVLR